MKIELLKLCIGNVCRDFYLRSNSSDSSVIGHVFVDLAFDISRLRRFDDLEKFLRAGRAISKRPLIVDAGANIGATSVYFSMQCQDALVVAIEPEPSNFQLLVENTKDTPVLCLPLALAATSKRMRVVDVGGGYWAFQTRAVAEDDVRADDVSSTTVKEIFEAHRSEYFPFIVKIDIEGGEKELFERDTDWMVETPLIIIELHDWMLPRQRTALSFLRSIAELDRDFVHFGENIFSIANNLNSILPKVS